MRNAPSTTPRRRPARALVALAVAALVGSLTVAPVLPPLSTYANGEVAEAPTTDLQSISVSSELTDPSVSRDSYAASTGPETLIAGGTNHDWARLVLFFGDWPTTDENVNVVLRWMRQENGPDNWWNRNNPLNNGYGSGGGSGLGSYDSLVTAAKYAADNLKARSFYTDIVAGLEAGTSADATARAIWASPWASSHYGNGTHWSTSPVPVIEAPADSW
ncbi:hypothetical protein MN032_02915 [Agromyces atrinae]|uniref:hypothetical protein n=1 Tax=Agromyces atrinae TaxID=592376 RepID=UPI001F5A701F|nr:hypothetical protein [Agromyces atrinae]MCI2956634.1 hypothetical protein [Agromyces atrinae]